MHRRAAGLLIALLASPAAVALQAQAPPTRLVLGTYADAVQAEVGEGVLREAYRRIGITIEVQRLAGDVALGRSAAGEVDGDILRVDGISESFPDLVQVPIPVTYIEVAVYARDSVIRALDWRDLEGLRVATVRGLMALERSVGDLRVRLVDTFAELYPLLGSGQVDAIVAPVDQTELAMARGTRRLVRGDLLGTFLLYHYLNRRHAALVPRIEPVLKSMLLDGTMARIRQTTEARLRSGAVVRR